ncbi:hypothetical protein [Crocosphaera sp.]|uniref:hypothetical protein n=1 Tax=Crocosphaera sp. TaxID=2729996 RepID=UPI00260CB46E|nr:hypothetical protein [Crocosphaera sp.]MDJ0581305.1 hypothetical protein [Crocosphaera sp.]
MTTDNKDRLAYLNLVSQGFQRAEQAVSGSHSCYIEIGQYKICLKFAGNVLIPFVKPSIAHLMTEETQNPDLTIHLWDSISTDTSLPLLLSSLVTLLGSKWWKYEDKRGEIDNYSGDFLKTAFYPYPNRLSVLDLAQNVAYYWVEDAQETPYYEMGASLRVILHWWLSQRQLQYVHAGAVGTKEGGVLMAGKGGSGKSTTALTCLNSGLSYASDDYSLVQLNPQPHVYSLYNTAKLKGKEDLVRFPQLASKIRNSDRLDTEKALLFVHEHFPEKVINEFPLKAILIPYVTGKPDTHLIPISAGKALIALSISTIFQLPGANQNALNFMSKLVQKVPCYQLALGTKMEQIPETILKLLSA